MATSNAPRRKKKRSHSQRIAKSNPDAAGVDLGATVHYAAVPADRDPHPVRSFGTVTDELYALADWLQACGIKTVAMEATGVYWIPLFQILEARGLEVFLVNARHFKNVPGRKTDVEDCQWLQYLHSVGLVRGSFRPSSEVCAIRSLMRHRDSLVRSGCDHLLRMQKALDQMNVQIHRVVSDLTGQTGLAILDAILRGERDPQVLAQNRDPRCKSTQAQIAAALHGDWRQEHLFTLRQSFEAWQFQQKLVVECDAELLKQIDLITSCTTQSVPAKMRPDKRCDEKLRQHLFEKFGVDLTAIDGVNIQTAYTFLTEVGPDLSKFESTEHFTSWLGLCPDNRKTGGRQIGVSTRPVANRLATVLRMAAQSLHRMESPLADWFRRMKAKLGAPAAATAAAHKLARVMYSMIKYRQPYDERRLGNPALRKARKEKLLRHIAKGLGYELVPIQSVPVS